MFRPEGRVLVFQPRPGMGDLIWHLPMIRAIAAASGSGGVTLLTKPSTQACVLLRDDPAVARIVDFERNGRSGPGRHDGALGFPRLVATLRACRARTGVLLHHGASLAAAMRLAGIPARHGYGTTRAQRVFLNHPPFLGPVAPFTEASDQAAAFADACGLGALPEPAVAVPEAWRSDALRRMSGRPRPWAVLGVGCHGADRQWGARCFAGLAGRLAASGYSVVLLAGAEEAALVHAIQGGLADGVVIGAALGWPLEAVAGLLAEAELFVGNDSGPMNLRAAVGKPAYALFGASGPLRSSTLIKPILPPAGPRTGMAGISVEQVIAAMGL